MFKQKNKKAIGTTISWFVAFIIIIVILFLFVIFSYLFVSQKNEIMSSDKIFKESEIKNVKSHRILLSLLNSPAEEDKNLKSLIYKQQIENRKTKEIEDKIKLILERNKKTGVFYSFNLYSLADGERKKIFYVTNEGYGVDREEEISKAYFFIDNKNLKATLYVRGRYE